jgi:hypothetical protein
LILLKLWGVPIKESLEGIFPGKVKKNLGEGVGGAKGLSILCSFFAKKSKKTESAKK